ncbi:chaplin family protein [Streptomyces griseus]|uniref:chaplin family protein n=1 Tax=Streptomyces griseus TaxID=1911 RepID=UPI0037F674C9
MKNLKKAAAVTMIAGGLIAVGAGAASATGHSGAGAEGLAAHSPGVASGNLVQVPVAVPVNVVGNTVNVVGLLNPAFGNLGLNH